MKQVLFRVDDLLPGQMKAVEVSGTPVVVVRNVDGAFYAYRNMCPHRGAAMTDGKLMRQVVCGNHNDYKLDDKALVLRCPWHNYEFYVDSGKCLVNGDPGLRQMPVLVEDGQVLSAW